MAAQPSGVSTTPPSLVSSLFPQLSDGIKQPGPARKAAFSRHIVLQGEERRLGDALPRHGSSPCPRVRGSCLLTQVIAMDQGHQEELGAAGLRAGTGRKGCSCTQKELQRAGPPAELTGLRSPPAARNGGKAGTMLQAQ